MLDWVDASVVGSGFVLFVEDDADLRRMFARLVAVFLERQCVSVGSFEELVALGQEALSCGAAILDINLGPNRASGIDAYAWLRQQGYTGRIAFLTGHASSHPLVVKALRLGDAEVFSKPIDLNRMRLLVDGETR